MGLNFGARATDSRTTLSGGRPSRRLASSRGRPRAAGSMQSGITAVCSGAIPRLVMQSASPEWRVLSTRSTALTPSQKRWSLWLTKMTGAEPPSRHTPGRYHVHAVDMHDHDVRLGHALLQLPAQVRIVPARRLSCVTSPPAASIAFLTASGTGSN